MITARKKKFEPEHTRKSFVLDCSVVLAWYFADETDTYADAVAISLSHAEALVPLHWSLEVANALLSGERLKRSTITQASNFVSTLIALPIVQDEHTARRAWSDTIALARVHNLSSYDAAYLELAIRRKLPLATLDRQLKAAAKTVGVTAYKTAAL